MKLLLVVAILAIVQHPLVDCVDLKVDCHPLDGATKEKCEIVDCVWSPVKIPKELDDPAVLGAKFSSWSSVEGAIPPKADIKEPWCYFPSDYSAYLVEQQSFIPDFTLIRKRESTVPDDIRKLSAKVAWYNSIARLRIFDSTNQRFRPELPKLNFPEDSMRSGDSDIRIISGDSGNLKVKRIKSEKTILESNLQTMIYSDKFIQISFKLPSPNIFGLGEHYDNFLKKVDGYKTYSFYNTDKVPLPGGRRSYGSFPFFVGLDQDGKSAYGVYMHNTNGMEVILQPENTITIRSIGGEIDLFFFGGPKALDVIKQYQSLVGLPDLPPRWALGFHLCRYNYGSIDNLHKVWNRTRDSGIPFDVQWTDIDYMNDYNDFTYDPDKFKGLPEFVENLHKLNMHYVPIWDPGLSQEDNYEPYQLGLKVDAFIKDSEGKVLVGTVWNKSGRTVFPDFSNRQTVDLWGTLFEKFHKEIPFDGAWIDMNEISNFVDGSVNGCPKDDKSIYKPGGYDLDVKTLCPSASHKAGLEYNVHNLYSFYEAIATYKALEFVRPDKRPFIISRASSPGQGHYGGHWSGDVLSTWDYLRWSIPSSIEHSMYGFNMMGTDICGFVGNTTRELCARWSTLGAFYTFSRNHNDDKSMDQDPVALGPTVLEATRNALTMRYSLLPYLYTLIYKAHTTGEPVVRSTGLQFHASDLEALDAESQFMWGSDMIISPVVFEGSTSKRTYLPKGRWFEMNVLPIPGDDSPKVRVPRIVDSRGGWHDTADVKLEDIPIFFRGGSIIPVYRDVRQTVPETVNQSVGLNVFVTPFHGAYGELYLDDGESRDADHNFLTMKFHKNKLRIAMHEDGYKGTTEISTVAIYPMLEEVKSVKANGQEIIFVQSTNFIYTLT